MSSGEWSMEGPLLGDDVWTGSWWEVKRSDMPDLVLRIRLSGTGGPASLSAIAIAKPGHAVGARDLRRVDVRGLMAALNRFWVSVDTGEQAVKPARPGPAGHPPEHWTKVWALYNEARATGSRSYIDWMRQHWSPPVPDATMRRWVSRAKQMHEKGEL